MEIENPGLLPFGMTIDQLKAGESKIRNRVVADVFDKLGLLEGWGRAWARIQEATKEGYPEPDFDEQGPYFKVTLYPHPDVDAPSPARTTPPRRTRRDRRQEILTAIGRGDASPAEISEAIGLSVRQTQRWLGMMTTEGSVELATGASETDPNRRYRATRPAAT